MTYSSKFGITDNGISLGYITCKRNFVFVSSYTKLFFESRNCRNFYRNDPDNICLIKRKAELRGFPSRTWKLSLGDQLISMGIKDYDNYMIIQ